MNTVLAIAAAYLLGSVSVGYLAGKLLKGVDIRQFGSGSTGTTNIQRTLGTAPAIIVLILDIAKGLLAVLIAKALTGSAPVQILAGLAAVAGHNWPVYFKFRGGRGVATTIGMFIGLAPTVILIAVIIGVVLIALTRYVSLGSMAGAASIPISMIIFRLPPIYILAGTVMAGLAIWRHRENIKRLLKGSENKLGSKVKLENEGK